MPDYVAGLSWELIKEKLKTETDYRIKPYDDDLNGVLDWRVMQFPGVRQEILAEFSDPKILIITSSMLDVFNSADKVEHTAGNISADSQELEIVGGSASADGQSWIYWDLPIDAEKVYVRAQLNSVNCYIIAIDICSSSGATFCGPPDFFAVSLSPDSTYKMFIADYIGQCNGYIYATDDTPLSHNTFYEIEVYYNWGTVKYYRDGNYINSYTNTSTGSTPARCVRIRVHDSSTAEAQSGKVRGSLVIIYE